MRATRFPTALAAAVGLSLLAASASPILGQSGPFAAPGSFERAPLRVVSTLPVYASVVQAIGGAEVEVESIAAPNEDAHFVRPKPSFALAIRNADVFITTGLDLELWVPALLDRAGNARVSEGATGYITVYGGVTLLDVPTAVDRSAGDVHVFGNPHLHTDPLRMVQVARNITAGLKRVAPERSSTFDAGLAAYVDRIHQSVFGARLVELLGGPTLEQLALNGGLFAFLAENDLEGAPLTSLLGGWLKAGEVFRGEEIICYHKNWVYFEDRFGVRCAEFVEAKPGIAPTPRHVGRLVDLMKSESIGVVLGASYFGADTDG
jgi:ABC-type Zn uptake system ZnuABC Zn-binding protein ZnuA